MAKSNGAKVNEDGVGVEAPERPLWAKAEPDGGGGKPVNEREGPRHNASRRGSREHGCVSIIMAKAEGRGAFRAWRHAMGLGMFLAAGAVGRALRMSPDHAARTRGEEGDEKVGAR